MLIVWVLWSVGLSVALSVGAVVWDLAVEAANKNERARGLARKVLLIESTEKLALSVENAAATLAMLPVLIADWLAVLWNASLKALAVLALLAALFIWLARQVVDLTWDRILQVQAFALPVAFVLLVWLFMKKRVERRRQ